MKFQKFLALAFVVSLCSQVQAQSSNLHVDDLYEGQTGKFEYNSVTPPNRWEYLREYKKNWKDVVIPAELFMPKNLADDARVPAVVLMHGSGGVNPDLEAIWVPKLNAAGYAALIVDSFSSRGIGKSIEDQTQIDISAHIADAYNALKILSTHPHIDAQHIALVGFSRGGQTTFESYFDAARKPMMHDSALRFYAFVPFYPGGCPVRIRSDAGNTNKTPMFVALAKKDDTVFIEDCISWYEELNASNTAKITWKIYNAWHAFDGAAKWRYERNGSTDRECKLEVNVLATKTGLGAARNYKTGQVITGFPEWTAERKKCQVRGWSMGGDEDASKESIADTIKFLNESQKTNQ